MVPAGGLYGLRTTCTSDQTSIFPAARSINPLTPDYVAFSSFKHMHTLGKRIWYVRCDFSHTVCL